MVMVNSTMLPLGTKAPDFRLPDTVSGRLVGLDDVAGGRRATVVMFLCNHCPFVVHVAEALAELAADFARRGVGFVGISSNDIDTHPDDAPELMKLEAGRRGYTFPYLYDETQRVARAYRAACTPDFFVFDARRALIYRGRFDASRPGGAVAATGSDLRAALDACLAGAAPSAEQHPSLGCNIKWKPGQAPDYFGAGR